MPSPESSTPRRRQNKRAGKIPYRRSKEPRTLLVDNACIECLGHGEWLARKDETTVDATIARSTSRWAMPRVASAPSNSR